MANKYEPTYQFIDEIIIKEIIFEADPDSSDVTIFGYCYNPISDAFLRVDYWCEFSVLTDLLIAAKESGEPIIELITNEMNKDEPDYPILIDVENLYQKPLYIDNIVLKIYRPMEEDENGVWKEDEDETFYIIDSLEAKEKFEQQKTTEEHLRNELAEYFILLDNQFKYYLQLLKLGIKEKEARRKAGLKDEILFRIATLNHQIIKHK